MVSSWREERTFRRGADGWNLIAICLPLLVRLCWAHVCTEHGRRLILWCTTHCALPYRESERKAERKDNCFAAAELISWSRPHFSHVVRIEYHKHYWTKRLGSAWSWWCNKIKPINQLYESSSWYCIAFWKQHKASPSTKYPCWSLSNTKLQNFWRNLSIRPIHLTLLGFTCKL
jgi:hypothetical protein